MAASLKEFFSASLVRRLARDLRRVHPAFPEERFVKRACSGLDGLELLDRGRHISRVLGECLPQAYPEAIALILRSLGPEHATDELLGVGIAPFFYLPHVVFVAERGLDHFDLSMRAQYELTKRFSAESSVRPYIERYPERACAVFRKWTKDDNAHVRRLVSEGTRLRLPWAARVPWLDAHPERVLELLELLKDDVSTLVRRSVANNLNDLGRVRPELLTRTCEAWLEGRVPRAPRPRRACSEERGQARRRRRPAPARIRGEGIGFTRERKFRSAPRQGGASNGVFVAGAHHTRPPTRHPRRGRHRQRRGQTGRVLPGDRWPAASWAWPALLLIQTLREKQA